MNAFNKKVLSILASGSVVLSAVSPVFADTITVTGNGSGSENVVAAAKVNTTTVSQTNNAVVTNNVSSTSNTGDNTASKNTNGDVTVSTGDATSNVSVSNLLNSNTATKACCDTGSLDILVKGNGAGDEEYKNDTVGAFLNGASGGNTVAATVVNDTTVVQNNDADVDNYVKSEAETGDNSADKNTGGDVRIVSGDADSYVGVSTKANSNSARIGGIGSVLAGHASAEISGNGADSTNGVSLALANSTAIGQTNSAYVDNDVKSEAETGDNSANKNTGGSVWIGAPGYGDATSLVGVETKANFNWAEINCCGTYHVDALISKNGADSYNTMALTFENTKDVVQTNVADVDNYVKAESETGDNHAYKNTGDDVRIYTGDADSVVGIDNLLNFNHASLDCCISGVDALLEKNGADSENGLIYTAVNTAADYQVNGALLANTVGGKHGDSAVTGDNYAGKNTGDPIVSTGDAASLTHVANTLNVNDAGSNGITLPGVGFEFNFSLNWVNSLLSLIHW